MAHASWGPGWPNCQTSKLITFTAGGRRWTMRREVMPIFKRFINEIVANGYRISDGQLDDWSFACRPIAGTNVASNHSLGLAVDINSLTNPMTFDGRLVTDMPRWVVAAATAHGLTWGGAYTGKKKDAMHFEWTRSVRAAELMVAHLAALDAADDGTRTPNELSLTVSEFTELKALIEAVRGDLLNVGVKLIGLEKSVHGIDDSDRDASIYFNTKYLRGELLGGENLNRLRLILQHYGHPDVQAALRKVDATAAASDT